MILLTHHKDFAKVQKNGRKTKEFISFFVEWGSQLFSQTLTS